MTSASIGFVIGAVVMAALAWRFRDALATTPSRPVVSTIEGEPFIEARPSEAQTPPAVAPPPPSEPNAPPGLQGDPVEELRARRLEVPVQDAARGALRDSFAEERTGGRKHEAIDILAPRNTPVVAVEGGTVAKLLQSDAGGITLYQFDPSSQYVYYYAHLEGYGSGMTEGARIRRNQVIGYVGTSGNAPKDTPHLHFAIFKLTDEKKWWQGTPVDPYSVLK